ncbi:cytochrome P450 [Streptomyces sp. NBC_01142]|uniref:cytochrome P450 n=1 Tax=Streptomyces sp. NBC_01142 TaxID=2975865 RepID=UPI002250E920|nr:cytochrome P450 [Streptomyces sp. NBC_01142]MCX4824541.1 cytochrome P450 [Streptomyces sp. NBC_01142]
MSESVVHLTPELVESPVPGYAQLREQAPLVRVTLPGLETPVWLATRYDDVKAALSERRLVRDRSKIPDVEEGPDATAELIEVTHAFPPEYIKYLDGLALFDGDEHTRRRTHLTRTFTARRVNALRPHMERTTADLLRALAEKREADLLGDFAYPLATSLICELIGVDEADRRQVGAWIHDFAFGDPDRSIAGLAGVVDHAKELIARRRSAPTDDLISALIRAGEGNSGDEGSGGGPGPLTEDEIISIVFLLINTGITPPALFFAHAVLALLDHPDQLARLRAEPELLPRAVAELLRWVTLVRIGATMYATEDFEFAGIPLRRGEAVTAALLAANHDPQEFDGPERLDIGREFGRGDGHIAFGHGPHYCLGATLGRLMTGVVFDQLLIQRPGLSLAVGRDELEFGHWPGDGFHLIRLPVRL